MKKQLLFTLAAAASVMAYAADYDKGIETKDVKSVDPLMCVESGVSITDQAAASKINESGVAPVVMADDEVTGVAMFKYAPGTFFDGAILNFGENKLTQTFSTRQNFVPGGVNLVWQNASTGEGTPLWSYYTGAQDLEAATSEDGSISVIYPKNKSYNGIVCPQLAFGGSTYDPNDIANGGILRVNGRGYYLTGSDPAAYASLGTLPICQVNSMANVFGDPQALSFANFTNYTIGSGSNFIFTGMGLTGWGNELEIAEGAVFGIKGFIVNLFIKSLTPETDKIYVRVYKQESNYSYSNSGDTKYIFGYYPKTMVAEAYITPEVNSSRQSLYVPVMSVDPEDPDITAEHFVNLEGGKYWVVIEGFHYGDDVFPTLLYAFYNADTYTPGALAAANNQMIYRLTDYESGNGAYTDDTSLVKNWRNWTYPSGGSKAQAFQQIGVEMYYSGGYSMLGIADVDYTYDAPVGGGETSFNFIPTYDIKEMYEFSGEGTYDWIWVEPSEEINSETGVQTVTITVDALPEGTEYRESTVKLEIPGAVQEIVVTQGDKSGIDSVANDAATVATRYYDLQGRELKAAPETGLFLKKEIKANGAANTVKVVK